MKKLFILASLSLLIFASCKKSEDSNVSENITQQTKISEAKNRLNAFIKEHNFSPRFSINGDQASSARTNTTNYNLSSNTDFNYYQSLIKRSINPDDYECGPTEINSYINNSVSNWTSDDFMYYSYFSAIPFDYVYVYDNTTGGQFYGNEGQYTNAINRTFKDLLRFWNIPTNILIRDAHGNIFNDVNKVTTILLLYSDLGILGTMTPAEAEALANDLKIVFGSANFQNFNHPLLTFNAFASPADPFFNTPKKIVMGDGIMKAYDDLGYSDVAPQAVLAHEYGHHVQFANGVDFGSSPEGTRRTELMADAFSAYFMTHKRGSAMNWKRVQQFLKVFFDIGDCAFSNDGHHGTPNQRMKAAGFGYQLATDAQKQGKILSSQEFITLFDQALPGLIAPDAN